MSMKKLLKFASFTGMFYEYEGGLGWMPWHKVIITECVTPNYVNWVSHFRIKIE